VTDLTKDAKVTEHLQRMDLASALVSTGRGPRGMTTRMRLQAARCGVWGRPQFLLALMTEKERKAIQISYNHTIRMVLGLHPGHSGVLALAELGLLNGPRHAAALHLGDTYRRVNLPQLPLVAEASRHALGVTPDRRALLPVAPNSRGRDTRALMARLDGHAGVDAAGESQTVGHALLEFMQHTSSSQAARFFRHDTVTERLYKEQQADLDARMAVHSQRAADRGEPPIDLAHAALDPVEVGGAGTLVPVSLGDAKHKAAVMAAAVPGAALLAAARHGSLGHLQDALHYGRAADARRCVCCGDAIARPPAQHWVLDCRGPDGLFDTLRTDAGLAADVELPPAVEGGPPRRAYSRGRAQLLLGDAKKKLPRERAQRVVHLIRSIHAVALEALRRAGLAAQAAQLDEGGDLPDLHDGGDGGAPRAGPHHVGRISRRTGRAGGRRMLVRATAVAAQM